MTSEGSFEPVLPDDLRGRCPPELVARLVRYLELLLSKNAEMNLTALRDPAEAWARHVVESLQLLPAIGAPERALDVGSGGGIPGMVVAAALPQVRVTLLEATAKKARFLEQTAAALELSNVDVVCQRAETAAAAGSALRERYDVVTARAVAPLRVLLELTVPFAAVGGRIVAVKGERAAEEISGARRALKVLHARVESTLRTPTATVLVLTKQGPTPVRYPRRPGEPKRRPL